MRTPAGALLWESWRLTRWRLGAVPPLATVCGWLVSKGPAAALTFFILLTAALLIAATLPIFGRRRGFPLSGDFGRPVHTAVLVAVPLGYVCAAAVACYLVPAAFLRVLTGLDLPLIAPAALIGALAVLAAGCIWFTRIAAIRTGLGFAGFIVVGAMFRFLDPFRYVGKFPLKPGPQLCVISATGYLVLGLFAIGVYLWLTAGVGRQRHGDEELSVPRTDAAESRGNSADIMVSVRNASAELFRWRCPVHSATAAEVWFEMRCCGIPVLVIGVLLALCIPMLMHLAGKGTNKTGVILVITACTFIAPFIAGGGASIWNRRNSARSRLSAFEAARAIDTGKLIGLQVLVMSLCISGAWILMAVSVCASLPLLKHVHDFGSPAALILEVIRTRGIRVLSDVVIGFVGLATTLGLLAAIRALSSTFGWRLGISAFALVLYLVCVLVGVAREWLSGAVIDVNLWALAIAIPLGTVLVFSRVLLGGVLSSRQAAVVSLVWLLFASLYLDVLLHWNGMLEASPAIEALAFSSALVPLFAAGLAPWSVSLIRHA